MALAGVPVSCQFRFPDTRGFFRKFSSGITEDALGPVIVSDQAFTDWERSGNDIDAFGEFCLMCQPVSEVLMERDCCVFHGSALRHHDKAILIAGGSGLGKSTHTRLLLNNHPDEFSVINGDKPVLECKDDHVIVHPSPWTGKEGLHGAPTTQLAGLFLIHRAEKDSVEKCPDGEAAFFSFPLVFQSFKNETVIRNSGRITEMIVDKVPCFRFMSNDIRKSSELLYEAIREVCN